MDKSAWLNDENIDIVLKYFQTKYPDFKIVTIQQRESCLSDFNVLKWNFEDTDNLIIVFCYHNHWMVASNIDCMLVDDPTLDTTNKPIFIYDTLNHENNVNGIEFLCFH